MNTPDSLSIGLNSLAFSRQTLLTLLEGFPEDLACHQPFPRANHMLWIMGHLVWADDLFLTALSGQSTGLPSAFVQKFAWKTAPLPSPSEYPALPSVRSLLDDRRQALFLWFRGLSAANLAAATPAGFRDMAATADMPGAIACHESLHVGQLSVVRKSLGLPRKIG